MIKRLLLLTGLAIVAVVLAHAAQWVWLGMFWWTDRYLPVSVPNYDAVGTLSYLAVITLQKACCFAVPAFLFATGFFVAYAHRGKGPMAWKLVGNRLKALLIPYLIWSIVIFLGDYAQGRTYPPLEYARRLLVGEAVPAYYYVIVLCQLYIVSPLLVPLARRHGRWLLLAAAAILLAVIGLFYWKLGAVMTGRESTTVEAILTLTPNQSLARWLFFFVGGLVAGYNLGPLKTWLVRHRWLLLAVAVLSLPLAVWETEWIFRITDMDWRAGIFTLTGSLFAVSAILAFLSFEGMPPTCAKALSALGSATFGIYLLHTTVLEVTARATQRYIPQVMAYPVLFQLLLAAVAVGVPWVIMRLVLKSPARRWHRYLFG